MQIQKSYWGIEGWETTTSSTPFGACFRVTSTSGVVHHIIFANDIANGCMGGGFNAYSIGTSNSVDYIVYIGDIAYNAAQGSDACYSGFNVYEPKASDTVAGTHIFAAGNFAWANKDGCSPVTDGEGINFDTWDYSQGGGTPYTQQGYITNNISFLNDGYGIEVENNKAGGSSFAHIFIEGNTQYGNRRGTTQAFCSGNGDLDLFGAFGVTATDNLIYTGQATDCSGDALYAMAVASSNSSTTVSGNYASGVSGNNTFTDGAGGFTFGTNVLGTNPNFANPVNPGAPSCGSFASVQACMATVIANFVPSASGASAYGYQSPGPSVVNALFPQWLCSGTSLISGIPSGLITPGCGAGTTVNPGMSQSAVQAAITANAGGTVTFAAGTYTITSSLTFPANTIFKGPVVPLATYTTGDGFIHTGYTPTATIQGNLGRTPLVTAASGDTIEYLAFNGETPSGFGGGALYFPSGNSNVTIQFDYFYGNQTTNLTCCGAQQDTLVWFDGSNPGTNAQNDTVSWNRFGASGNCSNIMHNVNSCNPSTQNCTTTPSYQGSSAALTGGYCGGVGIHTGATNLLVDHNVFYSMEQGIKQYTGTSNTASFCNLCTIENNDFSNIHRIAFETQINPGAGTGTGAGSAETIRYNSEHDPFVPFYGSFAISAANGTSGATNSTYNMLIANISGGTGYIAMADELWGNGSISSNNWMEGFWANGIEYNFLGNFTIQNDFFCGLGTPSGGAGRIGLTYINHGGGASTPSVSGNTPGTANTVNGVGTSTCTVIASNAPTIYPPPGSYAFPQTVTLTNTGINTSTWYTTDGSTPVPGTGTAKLYSVPFTMTAAGTVNAVGMWGAGNQPTTYVAGYGFAPSSVASAAYTGSGGTPTAATPVMTPSSQSFTGTLSVSVSDSTPSSTIYCTTNGTTPTTASPVYTGAFSFTASTTLQCIATATGFLQSGVGSGSYTLNTPTLTGGSLTNTGNINTLVVGAPAIQFTAVGNYSDSVNRNLPDSFSNTAVWSSSNGSILNVGSTGLVSCAAVGSANVQVTSSPTSIVFNIWTMTCTSGTTPTVATPVLTPVSQTFTGSLAVVISDSTGGSTIHYTTDGTTPTTSSPVYTGTFNVTATTTVKAIATATGYNQSAVGSATYMLQAATISSVYLTIPGNLNYTTIGAHVQFTATIVYSDGAQLTSTVVGVANSRGDSISSWTTSASGVGTISTSGSMLGVALGVTHIQAVINGSVNSNPWFEYVSASANTVTKGTTSKGVTIQ